MITTAHAQVITGWQISQSQPNIPQGGRVNSIAVNPSNDDVILATSESGGLFRSTDRGWHWTHVDSLPVFAVGVAYLPSDPGTVIATAGDDFYTTNGGGIWVSKDGGASWTQVPPPAAPAGMTLRFRADDISIAPDSGHIFVSTRYGVSISRDGGSTWTSSVVFPGAGVNGRVASVVALGGGVVLAGGTLGVRRSIDGGAHWLTPAQPPAGAIWSVHAFARSVVAHEAYVVNDLRELFFTTNDGGNWESIPTAPKGNDACGGIPFVRVNPAPGSGIDLYFGNRCDLLKLHCPPVPGTGSFDYSGTWATLAVEHMDTRDLAFDRNHQPLLLGTDGGPHQTADGGQSWTYIGGGAAGFTALQLTETAGQWIDDIGRYDLYFSTQDNSVWACCSDEGLWDSSSASAEGWGIRLLPHVQTESESVLTWVGASADVNKISGALFAGVADWKNPPGGQGGWSTPVLVAPKMHVQGVNASGAQVKGLAITPDLGQSWSQYAAIPEDRRDLPKPSYGDRTVYQGIRAGWDPARNLEINSLVRVVNNPGGLTGTPLYPLMNNFGGLGMAPAGFPWWLVFAVDPGNSDHLIAPDVFNGRMMRSIDGGNNWTEIPQLTRLVTDNGRFLFRLGHDELGGSDSRPHASAVSFCPDNPDYVVVGTWQGGVFISSDRGATWSKVPDSERVTRITSFAWRTTGDVFVSTYGRGLWRLEFTVILPKVTLKKYCRGCRAGIPAKMPEQFAHAVLAFRGTIQGARVSNGTVQEIFVRPGSSVSFFSDSHEALRIKVTETNDRMGIIGGPGKGAPPAAGLSAVGIVLGPRGELGDTIFSRQLLSAQQAVRATPRGERRSPGARRPYLELGPSGRAATGFIAGEPLTLHGQRFGPGTTLRVWIDAEMVREVRVGEGGTFSIEVRAPREHGSHSVTVRDGERVIDGSSFLVRSRDR